MKKTISINIGGIIFHIEEDGYDKLKDYLESVNKYFARFEDSTEIISDIEGRIAELFLLKLSDGRQTLTMDDVSDLIATMGTTRDFEATIEDDDQDLKENPKSEKKEAEEQASEQESSTAEEGQKRLYRDSKRSMLGGVASGIAHYFSIDPLWIRLLFLALFINIFFYGLSGATFLAYIILWIVIPPKDDLKENQTIKKLYRNPEGRVLGGVSSGIAAYFGTDVAIIRLIFVLSIFLGGSGVLTYIILWIITPVAKSITEKMQMSGKPVTLKNIEDNVKKSLKADEGEEKPLVKLLLFPFRLISVVIGSLGKILGPFLKFIVDLIRIAFGAILMLIGFSTVASLLVISLSILSVDFGNSSILITEPQLPLDLIRDSINIWIVISVFLITFIPSLGLALLGLTVIIRRRVANGFVGWSLFALWVLGFFIAASTIPKFVGEFKETNSVKTEVSLPVSQATPTLVVNEIGHDMFDGVDLKLRGHEDSTYLAKIRTESRGATNEDAQDNARLAIYRIEKVGENIQFDSKITFEESNKYRFQNIDATFYVPYDKVFRMDYEIIKLLDNTIRYYGYRNHQVEGNDWVFRKSEGLICLTCESYNKIDKEEEKDDDWDFDPSPKKRSYSDSDELTYPFEDFDELKIGAVFDIEISKSIDNSYSVSIRGEERELDEVYLNQVGDRLEVKYKKGDWTWKKNNENRVKLLISMPELLDIEVYGACEGEISGFDQPELQLELSGESDIYMNVSVKNMVVDMSGESSLNLNGSGEDLTIDINGGAKLNSLNYKVNDVTIDANGAAKAKIFAEDKIDASTNGMSSIKYKGASNVNIDRTGSGSAERL